MTGEASRRGVGAITAKDTVEPAVRSDAWRETPEMNSNKAQRQE